MTTLGLHVGATGVTALVVSDQGDVVARGHADLDRLVPAPGRVEHAPEQVWRATLEAARGALAQGGTDGLRGIGIAARRGTTVLWDRDTLGSPRAAVTADDRRATEVCARLRDAGHDERVHALTGRELDPGAPGAVLAWLAEHEPRTWALVVAGRYAVGTVDSYLVARMTRGLEHLTDVSAAGATALLDLRTGDWSPELCELLGVPLDALPELVPSWGDLAVSDPRSFLDLALPIGSAVGDRQASLLGQGCVDAGATACRLGTDGWVATVAGTSPPGPSAGVSAGPAWRSPDGVTTYAREVDLPGSPSQPSAQALARAVGRTTVDHPLAGPLRVGGEAADDTLCLALAEQLGAQVDRVDEPSTAALGAALLAGRR